MSTGTRTAPPLHGRRRSGSAADVARRWATDRRLPDVLAAGAILLSGVLLLHWFSRLTFWRDEWEILLHRRGWSVGTFLDPAVEHLVAIPILIYKILLGTFGMDSPTSFQVVAICSFLLSVGLLFVYVRSRVGAWLGLAAILPILFLGPSWDDLLFAYQVTFFGSIACGIAAFLCLDRGRGGFDTAAMALLIAGLLFSDAGIPFVAGAAVEVALSPERGRRAHVVAVPAALWAAWYLGWGHTAHTFISFENFADLPSYVVDGLSSSLANVLGLNTPYSPGGAPSLAWGRPLLVLAVVLAAWRVHRTGRPSARLLATVTTLIGFWSLTALNASIFGLPTVGRYQYIGIVLLVLVAAELLRGVRVAGAATIAVLAVAVAAALSNYTQLRDAANGLAGISQRERGGLAALELARNRVDPALVLTSENSDVDYLGLVDARSYLSAVDAYGSPAYSAAELTGAPEVARVAADKVSGAALGIHLLTQGGGQPGACRRVDLGRGPATAVVPPDGLVLRAESAGAQAELRRYALASFPLSFGALPAGGAELLRISQDASSTPWTVQVSGSGVAQICRAGASPR
jgi:hypothetical protein